MSFVHDDTGFGALLTQVADHTGIAQDTRIPLSEACQTLRQWVSALMM